MPGSDRVRSLARGLATGWALGLWEAGLGFAANANFFHSLAGYFTAPFGPLLTLSWGGAVLGLLWSRWPWDALYGIGALLLLKMHWSSALLVNWWWLPLGAAASLAAWWRLRDLGAAGARRARRAGLASLAIPPLGALGFALAAPEPHRAPAPTDATAANAQAPNVVLITWDTVRADSLPPLGGGGLDTPQLERLVAEGLLLADMQAVAPITGPAHATLITGLYPPSHGLRANGQALPADGPETLAEIFARAGYATGGFVSGYPLRAEFGFARGFQHFDGRTVATPIQEVLRLAYISTAFLQRVLPESLLASTSEVPGAVTTARALAWAAEQTQPVFLWVHYFDAHDPYVPPAPQRARALARAAEGRPAASPDCQEGMVLQRGEIEVLDALLGDLRAGLEARDPGLARTILALAADHGECFGEGGLEYVHESSLYAATQHVIGTIRPAGEASALPRGVRLPAPTSQVDFAPTLCALAGLPAPAAAQGLDLTSAWRGAPLPERALYMEAFQLRLGEHRMQAVLRDGWKYVRELGGAERLLHGESAGDVSDHAARAPERVAQLRAELERLLAELPHARGSDLDLDAEARRALQELGYVDG